MVALLELKQRVDVLLASEVNHILTSVPYSGHLISEEQELDEEYYIRHRIETIKRIVLTARVDALALARMIEEDYDSSRLWARYTAEELNHDLLYKRDLYRHGCSENTIDGTAPLAATQDLIAYLVRRLEETGSLAAVAYSLFVEWNSERVSGRVVARAQQCFSAEHVRGSHRHVSIDKHSDHYLMILGIAQKLVEPPGGEDELFTTLKELSNLFGSYFHELYDVTIGQREKGSLSLDSQLSEGKGIDETGHAVPKEV